MKVLGNLSVVKENNIKYPFGSTIQNETETQNGTPIVREIYADILMNLYEVMRQTGEIPNDLEDDLDTQFQLVNAFKKLANNINDINHVLELSGSVWSLPLDLAYIPDKFVCYAIASENYNSLASYNFKGIGPLEISFSSQGFNSGDQLLIVIDNNGVKAFSLQKLQETPDIVYTPLGSPIAFNDTDKMYYKENGYLISDLPSADEIQQLIRVFVSDGTLVLNDVFIHNGKVICFCLIPDSKDYYVFDLLLTDFNDITQVCFLSNGADTDFNVYSYLDINGDLFFTNNANEVVGTNDYDIRKYQRDIDGNFVSISMTPIDATFEKTTNAVIHNGFIYTFVGGYLRKYNLTTGIKTDVLYLPSVNGQLFRFNGEVYFTTGEVAKKWVLS